MFKNYVKKISFVLACVLVFISIKPITGDAWSGEDHWSCVTQSPGFNSLTQDEKAVLNYSSRINDNKKYYMGVGTKGQFHGGLWSNWNAGSSDCNYLACYVYLTKVANAFTGNGTLAAAKNYLNEIDSNSANVMYGNGVGYVINSTGILNAAGDAWIKWTDIQKDMNTWLDANYSNGHTGDIILTSELKRTFVYGMAIHLAGDMFAHSSWYYNTSNQEWHRISDSTYADNTQFRSGRYIASKLVISNILNRYLSGSINPGSVLDFAIPTSNYVFDKSDMTADNAFRLGNFYYYANKCGISAGDETYFQVPDAARTCDIFNWNLDFEYSASYPMKHLTHWDDKTHSLID